MSGGFHRACCCGGASTSCLNWTANCFDGDDTTVPVTDPTPPPITMTYTPCEGASDCAGLGNQDGDLIWDWGLGGYYGIDPGGAWFPILVCESNQWSFGVSSTGVPSTGCYGNTSPALVCNNGKYPTGTFNVDIYDQANGDTPCGTMTVTIGP